MSREHSTEANERLRHKTHELFLQQEVLPKQLVIYGCGIFRPFHLWCIGCEASMVFDYADLLETFRKSIPHFRYHLLVSDCDRPRIEDIQTQLEESGGQIRQGGEIEIKFESLEMWNIAIRKTQDVIVCGQKLGALICGSPESVLSDLCSLLFPGRYLLGQEDLLGLDSEQPLSREGRYIFRRTG